MFLAVKLPSNNNVPRTQVSRAHVRTGVAPSEKHETGKTSDLQCQSHGVEQQITQVEEERRLLSIEERPDPRDVPEVAEPNHKLLGYFRLR